MMDIPGFSPTRRVEQTANGFVVYVKPPDFIGTPEVSVFLTLDQYARYQQWRNGPLLIQDALPDLTVSEREMLMSGLGDENFHRLTKDNDDE
jgi:hypothetical protein